MYVSINLDTQTFIGKHQSYTVLAALWYIEAYESAVQIGPEDDPATFSEWTDSELRKLYENTTLQPPPRSGEALKALLIALAQELPVTDAIEDEVEKQTLYLEAAYKDDIGSWRNYSYVRGGRTPTRLGELFPNRQLVAECTAATVARAASVTPRKHHATHGSGTKTAIGPKPAATPKAAAPRAHRTAGVRETVWKVADEMWNAAGKPTGKPAILALRKSIMDSLEGSHQIKRNSSSNELGNWQKARVIS